MFLIWPFSRSLPSSYYAIMAHSHTHAHAHTHDFAQANKDHHNAEGHAHAYSSSELNIWQAAKCVEAMIDAYDWNEEETTLLDYACGP